jgi:glutamine synthetase
VIFNGDGYSQEWQDEAARRGLPNLRTAPDALPQLTAPEVVEVFEKFGVLSQRELESRLDIYLEQYVKTINTEVQLTIKMGRTSILPVAIRYQAELASIAANLKSAGVASDIRALETIGGIVSGLQDTLAALETAMAHHSDGLLDEAKYFCSTVLPAMLEVRKNADELEGIIPDEMWPLPTYQEMLFIK